MDLRTYLIQSGIGPTAFAERVGLSRNGLYKLLNGSFPRDATAARIEAETAGKVTIEDFWRERRQARLREQSDAA
jgi:hypothetical protein